VLVEVFVQEDPRRLFLDIGCHSTASV
jgi:hypothetical protein